MTFSFPVQSRRLEDGAAIYHVKAADSTGAVSVQPFLFFVDNESPKLEILNPAEDETVFGKFLVTGMVSDTVGVERLFIVWGKESRDIELRPGDPYWTAEIDLSPEGGRSVSLNVTAIDRSGNRTSIVRRLRNDTAAARPVVEVFHPAEAVLTAFPPDGGIYGKIIGGIGADTIVLEGTALEYAAKPGFRIPPEAIPPGRSDLRIRGRNADGTLGEALRIRV